MSQFEWVANDATLSWPTGARGLVVDFVTHSKLLKITQNCQTNEISHCHSNLLKTNSLSSKDLYTGIVHFPGALQGDYVDNIQLPI